MIVDEDDGVFDRSEVQEQDWRVPLFSTDFINSVFWEDGQLITQFPALQGAYLYASSGLLFWKAHS